MQQFRKKPVAVEARQYDGSAAVEAELLEWIGGDARAEHDGDEFIANIIIPTPEGNHTASQGDWIIKGVFGEFYTCKPHIFAATYEPVASNDDAP